MNDNIDGKAQLAEYIGSFSRDPLSFVLACFPWGKGELKNYEGPDEWQKDVLRQVGYALATDCLRRGAEVTLISGPTTVPAPLMPTYISSGKGQLTIVPVRSAEEMYNACTAHFEHADIGILCAAVADFTPAEKAPQKIKKALGQSSMTLNLDRKSVV